MTAQAFLAGLEALIKQDNATEHSYRPALKTLFEQAMADTSATVVVTRLLIGVYLFPFLKGINSRHQ
jgi:hypothetical protein